jgi:hypothetical protein
MNGEARENPVHYIFAGRTRPEVWQLNLMCGILKLTTRVEGQTCQASLLLSGGIYISH